MGVSHFTDLVCWQLADHLKAAVYEIIAKPDVAEDRDFCNDIKRSARSGAANISEGFGRFTHREFAHFLSIARASLVETENHLRHLRDMGKLTSDDWARLSDLDLRAQKATSRLRTYLLKTPNRRPGNGEDHNRP
jgi:four helix bundle protein